MTTRHFFLVTTLLGLFLANLGPPIFGAKGRAVWFRPFIGPELLALSCGLPMGFSGIMWWPDDSGRIPGAAGLVWDRGEWPRVYWQKRGEI